MVELPLQEFVRSQLKQGRTAVFQPHQPAMQRTISAEFVRELLFECVTQPETAPVGIAIYGARIEGNLHCIAFGSPAAPLPAFDLSGCELTGPFELTDSCFSSVTLNGCTLSGLRAPSLNVVNGLRANDISFESETPIVVDLDGLVSGGDVTMTNLGWSPLSKTRPPCRLRLKQARIKGSFFCSGAILTGDTTPAGDPEDGPALVLDGAEISGSVFLDPSRHGRFEASGEVRMLAVTIGGDLLCTGGWFRNPGGDALSLDRTGIARNAQLNSSDLHRFKADGEVRLLGAKIGGQLVFTGAQLRNPKGDALSMHRSDIRDNVYLQASDTNRCEVEGSIKLVGAKIAGRLDCAGARLDNSQGPLLPEKQSRSAALSFEGAEIAGDVWLSKAAPFDFEAIGPIEAQGARIGQSLTCEGLFTPGGMAQERNARAKILNFDNLSVGQRLTVELDARSWGEVGLSGARVGELSDNEGEGWGNVAAIGPEGVSGVLLKLDGFVYDRLCDAPTSGSSTMWQQRIAWLGRQTINGARRANDYFPQPHEQLAKVLRLMGHDYGARRVACNKSEHEAACGASLNPAMSALMWLYRTLFGAGYLPSRAIMTVIAFWLLGTGFVCWARSLNDQDQVVLARSMVSVELVRWLGIPDLAPMSPVVDRPRDRENGARKIVYAPHGEVQTRDLPCTEMKAPLYALDLMVPVVGLHIADKCDMADGATWWRYGKAIYEVLGWIIVAMAALTWAGVLRKDTA